MQYRKFSFGMISGITLVLVLFAVVGFVRAQTGSPSDDDNVAAGPSGPSAVAAIVNNVVQVQGRLTNSSGMPINGNATVTAAIYNVSTGGIPLCSDTDNIVAANGLFTMAMNFCTASVFSGDQLWLGIKVDPDAEMTPRQAIYAVPYAWGLRPGAIIKGADTTIFIPGNALIKNLNTDTTRWDIQANGAARIWRGASVGTKVIYIPVTLPGVLYGQNVTLKQLTVYYVSQNGANSYITETDLYVQTDAAHWSQIVSSTVDHKSSIVSSYTLSLSSNNVLTANQGILGLYFSLSFANDADYLQLGGVRLVLGHQ